MAHGVEAVLPLDIVEATYLIPPLNCPASTKDLIAYPAQQLQKCLEYLDMLARVLKARKQSAAEFVKCIFLYHPGLLFPSGLSSPCLQLLH